MSVEIQNMYTMDQTASTSTRIDTAIYGGNTGSTIQNQYKTIIPYGSVGSIVPVLPKFSKKRCLNNNGVATVTSPLGGELYDVDVSGNPSYGYQQPFTLIFYNPSNDSNVAVTMQMDDRDDLPGVTFEDTVTGYSTQTASGNAILDLANDSTTSTGFSSWGYNRITESVGFASASNVLDLKFLSGANRTWASGALQRGELTSKLSSMYPGELKLSGYSPIGPFVSLKEYDGGNVDIKLYPSIEKLVRHNNGAWYGVLCFGIKRRIRGLWLSGGYYASAGGYDYEYITRNPYDSSASQVYYLDPIYSPFGSWEVLLNGSFQSSLQWNQGSYSVGKQTNVIFGS